MSSDISGKSFSEEKKIVVNKWCDFHEFEIFFFLMLLISDLMEEVAWLSSLKIIIII